MPLAGQTVADTRSNLGRDVIESMQLLLAGTYARHRRRPSSMRTCLSSDAGRALLAGSLRNTAVVRDARRETLQLAPVTDDDLCPFTIDVDHLQGTTQADEVPLDETPFVVDRIRAVAEVVGEAIFQLTGAVTTWFGSGTGVHAYVFDLLLNKPDRNFLSSRLLSNENRAVYVGLYARCPAFATVVDTALARLDRVRKTVAPPPPSTRHAFVQFNDRMDRAIASDADTESKLWAILPDAFDTGSSKSGQLRLPFSLNVKHDRVLAGYSLPDRWLDSQCEGSLDAAWEAVGTTLLRTCIDLDPEEVSRFVRRSQLELPYSKDVIAATFGRFREHVSSSLVCVPVVSATLGGCHSTSTPFHSSLVTDDDDGTYRREWLPSVVYEFLTPQAANALLAGVAAGGVPPALWICESHQDRAKACQLGFPDGVSPRMSPAQAIDSRLPLALLLLCGLHMNMEWRGIVTRSILVSQFPVDSFAEALLAQNTARKIWKCADVRSWMNKKLPPELTTYSYTTGVHQLNAHCMHSDLGERRERTKQMLKLGGKASLARTPSESTEVGTNKRRKLTDTSERWTGRVLTVEPPLGASIESFWVDVEPLLPTITARRVQKHAQRGGAPEEAPTIEDTRTRARQYVDHLFTGSVYKELIQPEERLGYVQESTGWGGIKAVFKEIRSLFFAGSHSVDVARCHVSMLLGGWKVAHESGLTPDNALLDEMHSDILRFDEWIACERDKLPVTHLFRHTPAKVILSALLNHPSGSPWKGTPLINVYRALWEAADACVRHPLVFGHVSQKSIRRRQEVAFLLERHAVQGMIRVAEAAEGVEVGISVNDEVLLKIGEHVCKRKLHADMERACGEKLGFRVRLGEIEIVG